METELNYGVTRRRLSKGGIASLVIGLLVFINIFLVVINGMPAGLTIAEQWLIVGPAYVLMFVGVVMSIVSIIGQRRLWWLAIPGLILNGVMVALLVVSVVRAFY